MTEIDPKKMSTDQKLDQIMNHMKSGFELVMNEIVSVKEEVEGVKNRVGSLEIKVDVLQQDVSELKTDMRETKNHLKKIDGHLDKIEENNGTINFVIKDHEKRLTKLEMAESI